MSTQTPKSVATNNTPMRISPILLVAVFCSQLLAFRLGAQGTAFTFEGRLANGGAPANGNYDVTFTLYDTSAGGTPSGALTNAGTPVSNGLFAVTLNFGAGVFDGTAYWLQLAVRTNGSGSFTDLSPRQPIFPTPYSIYAANAGSAATVEAANITGTIPLAQLPGAVVTNNQSGVAFSGTFSGNGAGVTNVNLFSQYSAGAITQTYPGNFVLNSSLIAGANPGSVALADFNGDGRPDLVSANTGSKTLTIMTGSGGGIFDSNTAYSTPVNPAMIAAADANNDGKVDLIYSSPDNNTLAVLTNAGAGVFVSNAVYFLPGPAFHFAAADVNGDGKVDLISPNYNAFSVTVLTNNGTGDFMTSGVFGVGSQYPRWIAVADVNGDSKADVVVANYFSPHSLQILTNAGGGTFTTAGSIVVAGYALSVTAADVNGDGKPDLISSGAGGSSVLSVCTNNGDGTFTSVINYAVGSSPICVAAADVNNDGKMDLISANTGDNTLTVLTNGGSGTFATGGSFLAGSGVNFVAAGDVSGDGKPDLLSANYGTNTVSVLFNTPTQPAFTGSGAGLVNVPVSAITGGLTTNVSVLAPGNKTNTLFFANGILVNIQ
jgi:hypothetical protein